MSFNQLLDKISKLESSSSNVPEAPPAELVAFFVRVARGLRQWKQSTLAGFARVSLSTVERVERGDKVGADSLERIAIALGHERGYLTTPRRRLSVEEAGADLVDKYGEMEAVSVRPLRFESQVREIAKCQAFLIHRPGLGDAYDEQVAELAEWFELASFMIATPVESGTSGEGGRRKLYKDILSCVRRIEERGVTVLSGTINAPQEGIPDWKVALVSLTPKLSDPGASKRRVILVDRRCVALPGHQPG